MLLRELAIGANALERYQLKHGHYPAELSALVPEFLVALPVDWMDGKPLRYRPTIVSRFTLWSLGENGVDDGGAPRRFVCPTEDWDRTHFFHTQDAVWPQEVPAPGFEKTHSQDRRELNGRPARQ